MGIPLQFSKAELKKNKEDKEQEDNATEASQDTSEQEQMPEEPMCSDTEKELCEEPPAEPCILPDFCGLFEKAMQPFCPQPGININITIDMSKTKDGECDEEMKMQPHSTSFIRERQ